MEPVDDRLTKLAWLWKNNQYGNTSPVCPHCRSIFTLQFVLQDHGWLCINCGLDFGKVIDYTTLKGLDNVIFDNEGQD